MQYALALIVVAVLIFGVWYYWDTQPKDTDEEPDVPVETVENSGPAATDTDVVVDAESKVFEVTARNHEFSVTEIRVQEGDTVTINLTAEEGFHDWVVDEFDAATERVEEDGTASVTFVADAAGTYEYYCSVGDHRAMGMVGTLIVE